MMFTHDEKAACLYAVMGIAESDGPRTREENSMLTQISKMLGITMDEMLQGITFEAAMYDMDRATRILKPMSLEKKQILEDALTKMIEVDTVNDNKLGAWWGAQMAFELPKWLFERK